MSTLANINREGFDIMESCRIPTSFDYDYLPHDENNWHPIYWNYQRMRWRHEAMEKYINWGYVPLKMNYPYLETSIRAALRYSQWEKYLKKFYYYKTADYEDRVYALFHPDSPAKTYYFKSPVEGIDPVDFLNLAISMKRSNPKEPLSWRIKDLCFLDKETLEIEIMTRKLAY